MGSVPGSVFPQEGVNPAGVAQSYKAHRSLAPALNALGFFNAFAAPWFAAVYLLLFAPLAGCVLPGASGWRVRRRRCRRRRRGTSPGCRCPHETALPPDDALATATGPLRRRRFRLRSWDGRVPAEKGYRREAGTCCST